jgi:glutaredoxin
MSALTARGNHSWMCIPLAVKMELRNKFMSLVLYTKPGCPYCQRAKDHYNAEGIEFIEYDAQNDKQRQKEMLEITDGDTVVPAIVENGVYIGSGWGTPRRG